MTDRRGAKVYSVVDDPRKRGSTRTTPALPDWLPGIPRHTIETDIPHYTHERPVTKLTLHTTEGYSLAGTLATYKARGHIYPHLTLDLGTIVTPPLLLQHVPLDLASYSELAEDRSGNIQIEMVGYAKDSPTWPPYRLRALGQLLAGINHLIPAIPLTAPFPFDGNDAYGLNGSVRQTEDAWNAGAGIVGHQHVPKNTHWDPGQLPIDTILDLARNDPESTTWVPWMQTTA